MIIGDVYTCTCRNEINMLYEISIFANLGGYRGFALLSEYGQRRAYITKRQLTVS